MNTDYGKVAVLMGGPSAEREVSLTSGQAVVTALQASAIDAHAIDADHTVLQQLKAESFDRAFIALHGRWGEDGVIQGGLEVIKCLYTGSRVLGSALAMDKVRSKQIWQSLGLPTPDFCVLHDESDLDQAVNQLAWPMFVKPAHEGSSLGINRVETIDQLRSAFNIASQFDPIVLAESYIAGRELTVSILAEEALPIIELHSNNSFYDYQAKYESDATQYLCPAKLDSQQTEEIQQLALSAFNALGCSGWGRVDLMLDTESNPHLLEANTVPGMTSHSLVPMAAKTNGMNFQSLVLRILETSL